MHECRNPLGAAAAAAQLLLLLLLLLETTHLQGSAAALERAVTSQHAAGAPETGLQLVPAVQHLR